jgi:peroxiredoxin
MKESAVQGVSAPMTKKPIKKTRAGKRTFVPPAFPSIPTSIGARIAARKSTKNIVYSEKRVSVSALIPFIYSSTCFLHGIDSISFCASLQSKQRVDTLSRVPIVIPVCIQP